MKLTPPTGETTALNQAMLYGNRSSAYWIYQVSTIENDRAEKVSLVMYGAIARFAGTDLPTNSAARNFQATLFWADFMMDTSQGMRIWNEENHVIEDSLLPPTPPIFSRKATIKSVKRGRGRPIATLDFDPTEETGE